MQKQEYRLSRRQFIAASIAASVMHSLPGSPMAAERSGDMQYRPLGRTGEKVSIIGLGGFHIGKQETEEESIRIIRTAIDNGINFMDNCWDYNNGQSEIRMGKALREGYRQKVFLMTKIDGRDRLTAAKQIEESLVRLQTDRIDLLQFHEIIRTPDPGRIFAPKGAMEAVLEARKAGKIRYIGFTGHKSPSIHLEMLRTASRHGFSFDTVQMPLNVMDAHYDSFEKQVLPILTKENIGVLGMKPMGDGYIVRSKTVTPIECLHYAMNLPTSVVITGIDSLEILRQALQAARSFRPLTAREVALILAKTKKAGRGGTFELYKTGHTFDGTYSNPQWLGPGSSGEAPAGRRGPSEPKRQQKAPDNPVTTGGTMGANQRRYLLMLVAVSAILFSPALQATGAERPPAPPVSQQPVREGDFAIRLGHTLGITDTEDEVEAETALGNVGISPRNGWIADYPVTPDIVGEIYDAVGKAADSDKVDLDREEALAKVEEVQNDTGVMVRPSGKAASRTKAPPNPPEYPDQTIINNYYESEGPPIVSYYSPPPDYFYLYNWVPYPFFAFDIWFPGFFILNDFHRPFRIHNRVRFLSNHFNDIRGHRVFRVDPGQRFRGRTFAGIGAQRGRGFISTGVPRAERRIFNSPRTAPFRGGAMTSPRGGGPTMRSAPGGVTRMPSGGGGSMRMPSGGGGRATGGGVRR